VSASRGWLEAVRGGRRPARGCRGRVSQRDAPATELRECRFTWPTSVGSQVLARRRNRRQRPRRSPLAVRARQCRGRWSRRCRLAPCERRSASTVSTTSRGRASSRNNRSSAARTAGVLITTAVLHHDDDESKVYHDSAAAPPHVVTNTTAAAVTESTPFPQPHPTAFASTVLAPGTAHAAARAGAARSAAPALAGSGATPPRGPAG